MSSINISESAVSAQSARQRGKASPGTDVSFRWDRMIFGICLVAACGLLAFGMKRVGDGLVSIGHGVDAASVSVTKASERLNRASNDLVIAAEKIERASGEYSAAVLTAQQSPQSISRR